MSSPVLLLDVMDTLVHDPFYDEALEFFSMTLEELFAVKDKDAWLRFERGETEEESLAAEYFTDRRPLDLVGLRNVLGQNYRWLHGIEALLSDLRAAGVPMHALSNYPTWWQMIEDRLAVSRYVEWSFVSCRTGVRKPAREAYLRAAASLRVTPSDCIFVDDRERNCAAARAVGMRTVKFESAAQLRSALSEFGLALPP